MKRPASNRSAAKTWLHALELTAPIGANPHRIFPVVIEELADKLGEAPALLSDRECLTYRALAERSNRYARWTLEQGIAKGDVVCLFMPNRPEYMAIWLGITRVGGVDRKSTRLNSSHSQISYAVFCLKKKNNNHQIILYEPTAHGRLKLTR